MGSVKSDDKAIDGLTLAEKTGLSKAAIENLHQVLSQHPKVELAILYGSRAMGTHRPGSDIDLTLCGDDINWNEFLAIEGEIDELLLPWKLDLSLLKQIENSDLLQHIERVGIAIYQRRDQS